jgi:hypothetical protein
MAKMAGLQGVHGEPVDRDQYAAHLREVLEEDGGRGLPAVSEAEARVIAGLLDELAAVYPGEALGRLARDVSVRLWDRLGI